MIAGEQISGDNDNDNECECIYFDSFYGFQYCLN